MTGRRNSAAVLLAASAMAAVLAGVHAQEQTQEQTEEQFQEFQEQFGEDNVQEGDELVAPEQEEKKIRNPVAEFTGLDKITGRVITFDVLIDETVQFGALQVTPRVCFTRPPTEPPQTTTFVEIDEVTLDNEIQRIFTGWMFADSPGLNAVEHPVYDVWLTNCKDSSTEVESGSFENEAEDDTAPSSND